MRSRGLVAALAILMAAVATTAVFLYIQGIRKEVKTGGETATVIIAQQDIPAGTDLDAIITEGAFTNSTVPEEDVVIGAVDSLSDLKSKKTSSPILQGEQVSTARLQGSTELPGGVLGIPKGYEGLSLSLDLQRSMATSVQPGDHVKIFATFDKGGAEGGGAENQEITVNLVADTKVLEFLGADAAAERQGSSQPLITLALKPRDTHEVVYSMEKGTVWLALLPPDEAGKHTPPITLGKLIARNR